MSAQSRDDCLRYLETLSTGDFVEVLAVALATRREDMVNSAGERAVIALCLAKCVQFDIGTDCTEDPDISLAAVPSVTVSRAVWGNDLVHSGKCELCGAQIASVAKLASCPLCACPEVECS